MERTIDLGGVQGAVSLTSPVLRYPANPVLAPADVNRVWRDPGLQVVTVHNAGAAIVGGETALLFRSHLRCGMSILGVARSRDGITNWRVDQRPALVPATLKDSFGPAVSAGESSTSSTWSQEASKTLGSTPSTGRSLSPTAPTTPE